MTMIAKEVAEKQVRFINKYSLACGKDISQRDIDVMVNNLTLALEAHLARKEMESRQAEDAERRASWDAMNRRIAAQCPY